MDAREALDDVTERVRQEFEEGRRILSFVEYLELFLESPYLLSRSSPQYAADMLEFFGASEIAGDVCRYRLFDQEFPDAGTRIFGQELATSRIQRLIRAAADEGRTEKLILLHGPNGSGKSVIAEAIFRGLEHYSHQPDGALYRFNWVFPKSSATSQTLGFTARGDEGEPGSYARLDAESLAARLICELKDHPLFLVPKDERPQLVEEGLERRPDDRQRSFRWVLEGDLSQKNKLIYEGLLTGYQGDWQKVMRHVQVERWFISQRFRSGAVTILPMGSVDAGDQQISADLSAQNLPPVLLNLKLFEPMGDLVDANGGVVEFGDFLKRPVDLNKYLLNAVEKGTVNLPSSLAYLNLVMLGTSNEKHLDAFKTTPEFTSFKGRIELVPVPYILEYEEEAELYREMVTAVSRDVHVAPHTYEAAALWAVLTRLLKPDPEGFEEPLSELVKGLTPLEKARLYNGHVAPDRLEREERKVLLGSEEAIRAQYTDTPVYEGRFGASAREMRMVLTQAAYDREGECLTPDLVFAGIQDLIRDKTVYDFLKLKETDGYHAPEGFVDQVAAFYARTVLEEFQEAMQIVSEVEYDRRFDAYFVHVLAFNRGETVENPQTGQMEPPSENILHSVEDLLEFDESRESFRKDLVARIGAFAVDHPEEKVNFRDLFPDLLRAVKEDFFRKRRETVERLVENLLKRNTDEYATLPADERELVETALENLVTNKGYCESCAREAAAFLRRNYPE
ncbi:MAG: PrkA family serine protein kinase [Planctomycetota bacterium]|jgi:predicted Ser/Thr protein kinase